MEVVARTLEENKTPELARRKADHIELAMKAQVDRASMDERFHYEPLLSGHKESLPEKTFLGKTMRTPIWVSSMTGGTKEAYRINQNLARACREFGMGMGLGSCRPLLESNDRFEDFNLRPVIGPDQPFYANLGIAQIEHLLTNKSQHKLSDLVNRLQADGLIIHVNPLQEWLQPEGDRFSKAPLETIEQVLNEVNFPVIVKEVGQGMGPASLAALVELPLAAIDFGALGGTNFALLELMRGDATKEKNFGELASIGHHADEMVDFVNALIAGKTAEKYPEIIVSGGVKNYLDGYYAIEKIQLNAVYGQASALLNYAREDYDTLAEYLNSQVAGLKLAYSFLRIKH